ncbi:hypothetical protein CYMTET_40434 [Cymbomonas tetramitiformis]|uniref:Uncharacterized protein n=1 Tax=Cymbomonas tetramitiformis TaxID=36881 RepID=A0AAE0C9V8_9CHLO|nr:hypothetical protein CYMTET_47661 [Cymbomonas tetramitiformis]KAK3250175.1 hypothetical protein CYMTET_40434 [Cymbomonas tetramitiformis]
MQSRGRRRRHAVGPYINVVALIFSVLADGVTSRLIGGPLKKVASPPEIQHKLHFQKADAWQRRVYPKHDLAVSGRAAAAGYAGSGRAAASGHMAGQQQHLRDKIESGPVEHVLLKTMLRGGPGHFPPPARQPRRFKRPLPEVTLIDPPSPPPAVHTSGLHRGELIRPQEALDTYRTKRQPRPQKMPRRQAPSVDEEAGANEEELPVYSYGEEQGVHLYNWNYARDDDGTQAKDVQLLTLCGASSGGAHTSLRKNRQGYASMWGYEVTDEDELKDSGLSLDGLEEGAPGGELDPSASLSTSAFILRKAPKADSYFQTPRQKVLS